MNTKKKNIILSVVLSLAIILLAVSVTYAYFASNISSGETVDIKATTATQASIDYQMGEDLELVNAEPGDSAQTISSITLHASNSNSETFNYQVRWVITTNDFETVSEHSDDPQLKYSLYYSSDNSNWTLHSQADATLITTTVIAANQSITAQANSTNTIYWKLVVSYEAYNYNQAVNMSKTLNGHLEFNSLD